MTITSAAVSLDTFDNAQVGIMFKSKWSRRKV